MVGQSAVIENMLICLDMIWGIAGLLAFIVGSYYGVVILREMFREGGSFGLRRDSGELVMLIAHFARTKTDRFSVKYFIPAGEINTARRAIVTYHHRIGRNPDTGKSVPDVYKIQVCYQVEGAKKITVNDVLMDGPYWWAKLNSQPGFRTLSGAVPDGVSWRNPLEIWRGFIRIRN